MEKDARLEKLPGQGHTASESQMVMSVQKSFCLYFILKIFPLGIAHGQVFNITSNNQLKEVLLGTSCERNIR